MPFRAISCFHLERIAIGKTTRGHAHSDLVGLGVCRTGNKWMSSSADLCVEFWVVRLRRGVQKTGKPLLYKVSRSVRQNEPGTSTTATLACSISTKARAAIEPEGIKETSAPCLQEVLLRTARLVRVAWPQALLWRIRGGSETGGHLAIQES